MSKNSKIMYSIAIIGIIASIWFNYLAVAISIGIFSIWFGIYLFKITEIDPKILLLVSLQSLLVCLSFGLLYYEICGNFLSSMVISFQNLFHVNLTSMPELLEKSRLYPIISIFETFVGYLLIISGVAITIKSIDTSKDNK